MSNVVNHPAAALMAEAKAEQAIVDMPEAKALQHAILDAVTAYYEFLNSHGLFYDADRELLRASGLNVFCDMCGTIDIILKDGPIDRCYGNGEDPDPCGGGHNPTRSTSKGPRRRP
jgi:hypothetical protein